VPRGQRNGSLRPLISVFKTGAATSPIQVAPQLSLRGWVDPVPDPLLLRKSGSAGNRTRDLWICSQELRCGVTICIITQNYFVAPSSRKSLVWILRVHLKFLEGIQFQVNQALSKTFLKVHQPLVSQRFRRRDPSIQRDSGKEIYFAAYKQFPNDDVITVSWWRTLKDVLDKESFWLSFFRVTSDISSSDSLTLSFMSEFELEFQINKQLSILDYSKI
jgi:hypothetical protein